MSYYRAKYINGCGPYWYEAESVRNKDGSVTQKHIRYIGKHKPASAGAGQPQIEKYEPAGEPAEKGGHISRKWSPERRRRAQLVADQVGCTPMEADALIKRARQKGYDYDEVDWDRLQGKDLEFSERVGKLEDQVGNTRTKREAKQQHVAAMKADRASQRRRKADGDNYDPETDTEGEYAYRTALAEYEEERGAAGHRSSGYADEMT